MDGEHPRKTGQRVGESAVLSCNTTFNKAKERFLTVGLVCCKIRIPTSLEILPQEGSGSMERVYPWEVGESHRICIAGPSKSAPQLKAAGKDRRGDCYINVKGATQNSKEHKEPRKHDITKRSLIYLPVTDSKDREDICDLHDKEFNIALLRKLMSYK